MTPLILSPSGRHRGGAEEALLQYVEWRTAKGEFTHVIILEPGDFGDALKARGAKITQINAGQLRNLDRYVRTILTIARIAKKDRPSVIFGWMTKAQIYGGPAGKLSGVPSMYFQMGLPDGGSVDKMSRKAGALGAVGCSEFVAREQSAVVKHKVLPVPLAADLSRFEKVANLSTAEAKKQLGFDPDRPLVGIVGRLQRWKGMHHYLDAMAKVVAAHPEVQGVIVGGEHDSEPEYPGQLKEQATKLGLDGHVRFAGMQRNVPEWMKAMDIVIHASEREPFGIVILEGMSLGKAAIATIPGGPEEIIIPGESGQLVQWSNVDELATAINRYLDDPAFAATCGQGAARRALEFSPAAYCEKLENALISLLPGKRSS